MTSTVVAILALLVAMISCACAVYTYLRFRPFGSLRDVLSSAEITTLSELVAGVAEKAKRLEHDQEYLRRELNHLASLFELANQKVGVHRFNALPDEGGNLSFAVALLDGLNSGVVITSLHGRTGNRMYAKPISGGTSPHTLTEEEQEALQQALTTWLTQTKERKEKNSNT